MVRPAVGEEPIERTFAGPSPTPAEPLRKVDPWDEPELQPIASWVARGLTAYDAAYVALAEERGEPLVTDDQAIVAIAGDIAQQLVG